MSKKEEESVAAVRQLMHESAEAALEMTLPTVLEAGGLTREKVLNKFHTTLDGYIDQVYAGAMSTTPPEKEPDFLRYKLAYHYGVDVKDLTDEFLAQTTKEAEEYLDNIDRADEEAQGWKYIDLRDETEEEREARLAKIDEKLEKNYQKVMRRREKRLGLK